MKMKGMPLLSSRGSSGLLHAPSTSQSSVIESPAGRMRITFVPVKLVMTIPARAANPISSKQASNGRTRPAVELVRAVRGFIGMDSSECSCVSSNYLARCAAVVVPFRGCKKVQKQQGLPFAYHSHSGQADGPKVGGDNKMTLQ